MLGRGDKSLFTPIVIANGDDFAIQWRLENQSVTRGCEIMHLHALRKISAPAAGGQEVRRALIIPLAHGLHARPAARLADLAKSFSADIAMESGTRRASLRSPVAMMGLGLAKGASVSLVGTGVDADAAIAAIAALVESGMGETVEAAAGFIAVAALSNESGVVTGVRAAPGLALGK